MTKKVSLLLGLFASMLMFVSCASFHDAMREDPAPVSDFLPNHELLEKKESTFPFHYLYIDKSYRGCAYVYVAPVDYSYLRKADNWDEFNEKLDGNLESEMLEFAGIVRDTFIEKFQDAEDDEEGNVRVIDDPKKTDCMILELAVTGLVPTEGELHLIGFVGDFFIPGLGLLSGMFGTGSLTIEGRVRDSKSGKIVAMFATTERDEDAMISVSNFTWLSSAKANTRSIASMTVEGFNAENAEMVKRGFPIKFLSY